MDRRFTFFAAALWFMANGCGTGDADDTGNGTGVQADGSIVFDGNVVAEGGIADAGASVEALQITIAPNVAITRPGSASVALTVLRPDGLNLAVDITVANLPQGVSAAPLSIAAGQDSGALMLTASANAAIGSSTVIVTATSGAEQANAMLNLQVTATLGGALDPTFGGDGIVTHGSNVEYATAIAIQANGRLVVGGTTESAADANVMVVRYLEDGQLDPSFNGTGKVVITRGNNQHVHALSVDASQRIVIAGSDNSKALIGRLVPSGAADPMFGTNGFATDGIGALLPSSVSDLEFQSNGSIITSGLYNAQWCIARYLSSGVVDPSFGDSGYKIAAVGSNRGAHGFAGRPNNITSVGTDGQDIVLFRVTAAGAYAPGFGMFGKVTSNLGGVDTAEDVVQLITGGFIVAGASNGDIAVARYTAAGALDTAFGSGGKTLVNAGGVADTAYDLTLQNDGKIVVVGTNGSDFVVVRLTPSGALDPTFANQGVLIRSIGTGEDVARAVVLDAQGRIVLAGHAGNGADKDFAVMRVLP